MEDSQEVYVIWNAVEEVVGRCGFLSLNDSKDGLCLTVFANQASGLEIELKFDLKDVIGYKVSNDSYTWRSDSMRKRDGEWSMFKVEGSNYIQWFKDETYGASDLSAVMHFSFLLGEVGVDIVSFNDPQVKVRARC